MNNLAHDMDGCETQLQLHWPFNYSHRWRNARKRSKRWKSVRESRVISRFLRIPAVKTKNFM